MKKKIYIMNGSHIKMRGFEYLLYSTFSIVLLFVLLLLPLAPVFASEIEEVEAPQAPVQESEATDPVTEENDVVPLESVTDSESVVLDEVVTEPSTDASTVTEEITSFVDQPVVVESSSTSTDLSDPIDSVSEINEEPIEDLVIESTPDDEPLLDIPTPSDATDVEDESSVVLDTVASTTLTTEATTTLVEEEVIVEIQEVVPEETENTTEDTEIAVEETFINEVTNDENRFTFSKDECAEAGDGTFYCTKKQDNPAVTFSDRVFSAKDADGDTEIYIEKDGVLHTITDNSYEDEAVYFDDVSNTIVWHRLMEGRYQIIAYDVEDQTETQLTHDRYNNMQPTRYGKTTVWQGWIGDDWDILMLDGDTLTMLTDNNTEDIAPTINGTHVIWQSFEENVWKMKVYDLRTAHIDTVENTEGGSIENPRFVLVYDTKFETGDVETKGFDLKSGKVLNLGSTPAPVPEEIPDPEQTGEDRALVAPSAQLKTKVASDETDDDTPDDVSVNDVVIVESSDVLVPAFDASTTTDLEYPEIVVPIESDDLIIEPIIHSDATTSTAHIEDLIITPFVEPITQSEEVVQ